MITDLAWAEGGVVLNSGGHPELVSGVDVVRQDLLARLHCPPGRHWAYPEQGVDLIQFVQGQQDELTLLALRQDAEIGAEQDTRVLLAEAVITPRDLRTVHLRVQATLTSGAALELTTTIGGSDA